MKHNTTRRKHLLVFLVSLSLIFSQSGYLLPVGVYGETADPKSDVETVYMLTDKLEDGGRYIIADGSDGVVNVLDKSDGKVTFTSAEVTTDANGTYIKAPDDIIVWTAESKEGSEEAILKNDKQTIVTDGSELALSHSEEDTEYWSYESGTKHLSTENGEGPVFMVFDDGFRASDTGGEVSLYVETEIVTDGDADTVTERGPPAAADSDTEESDEPSEEPAAADSEGTQNDEQAEEPAAVNEEPVVEAAADDETDTAKAVKTGTVLAFTSDIHNSSDNVAANRLADWIDEIVDQYGGLDAMGFCGDMGSASANESQFWTYAQAVMTTLANKGVQGVYTTGNHEFYNGKYATTTNAVKNVYIVGDVGLEGDDFIIYCLGTDNWNGNEDNYTQAQIDDLAADLDQLGTDKPIIVLTHFPLHHFSSRTTTNAKPVIDVLNAQAAQGKKIVLLWGHNHTLSDTYYDQIYAPGDSIEYKSGSSATVNFYYAAAGCMSDSEYGGGWGGGTSGSASVKGKGLVITINSKKQLSFAYYNADGDNVTEGGTFTEQDPVPVTGIAITEANGPDEISVEAGRSVTLHAVVSPADATAKAVTWSSSDTSVATVNSSGKVTGKNVGTATITATVTDTTTDTVYSADIDITVTERIIASSDEYYVIMIGDLALSSHASSEITSNSSGYKYHGLEAVPYDPDDPAPCEILWALEQTDTENGYYIKSYNGEYLSSTYVSNDQGYTGTLTTGETLDIWVVTDEGGLDAWQGDGAYIKTTNGSDNPRPADIYLTTRTSDNSVDFFTVGSSNNYKTSKLVEPAELLEPVAVTGIELDAETLEIEVGRSASLTATVLPADADDKTVEWTTSDADIVTVDSTGHIKGIAAGTATITATTNDGGHTATCEVTVIPSSAPGIGYIITIGDYALSVEPSPDQLVNSSNYYYRGLAGVPYNANTEPTEDILWLIEPAEGGYYILSQDGRYLNAVYNATTDPTGCDAELKLDDTPDVWTFEGSLEDWAISGSTLHSANAGKYMTHEEGSSSSPMNLFTVRSTGETSSVIDPDNPAEARFIETDAFKAGSDYIVAVTKDGNGIYALKNVTGTSSGNTGSAELTNDNGEYFPASGGQKAYIVTDDPTIVWNYTSNKYLSNNGRYLSSPHSGTAVPYASSSGRAITYDPASKSLSLSYNGTHYLTNSEGTFGYSSTSGDAAEVRLFESSTAGSFKYVVQFVGTGVNYYSAKYAAGEIPVYDGVTPTKDETEQYTFAFSGWSSDGGATVYGPDETLPEVDGPVTYVAQFVSTPKLTGPTVTFETNGGSAVEAQSVKEGEKATRPEDPTKEGCYAFDNWYSDEGLTTEYDFDTPVTGDITLYAKWNDRHTPGEAVRENEVAATCDADGSYDEVVCCAVCGTEISRESKTIEALGHDWSEWTVTTPATCTVEGSETRACGRCDAVETRPIDKIAHTPGEAVRENEVAPACTADGSYDEVVYCTVCNNEISRETRTIEATGHAWGPWTVTKLVTCTEPGTISRVCANDESHVDTITIPAPGHATVRVEAKPADCSHEGNIEYYTCENCGKFFEDEAGTIEISESDTIIPKTEHPALTHAEATSPTCTADGNIEYWKCEACGKYFSDANAANEVPESAVVIEATGHDFSGTPTHFNGTCVMAPHDVYTCLNGCGERLVKWGVLDSNAHTWGKWTKVDSKQHKRVCAHDANHVQYGAHNWDTGKVTKEATASAAGVRTYTCKDCGATRTETLPMKELAKAKITTAGDAEDLSMTIRITKVTGATDYQIQYRKAGAATWKSVKTGGKTKYTVTGLKAKGCYEFRARAYRAGDKSYGAYSAVSYCYMKTITPTLTSSAKGQLKVTWSKVSGASGYQVQYATKSDMSDSTVVKVSGVSKTSKLIKDLKSGKTYYVKIRPYKVVDGKTYYGVYSAKKTKKVK